MKLRILLSVLCIVGWIPTAYAQGAQRTSDLIGAGGFSCGKYLQHRRENNAAQNAVYESWVWGYLSGYNFFGKDPQIRYPEAATVHAYLEKFCRENPLRTVTEGVDSLIGDLGGWRRSP